MTFRNALIRVIGTLVLAVGLTTYSLGRIIPSAHAADVFVSSSFPTVFYNDTGETAAHEIMI